MKVLNSYPPNFDKIRKVFNPLPGVVFTYGDTLYAPGVSVIPGDLMAHEQTHEAQQKDPEAWWDRYLKDVQFRIDQEVEAYHNQYMFIESKTKDRNERARFLHRIAADLCGSMYGNVIDYSQAVELIKNGLKSS